ncbi:MAG TPA: hypothetical protein VN848_00400 [Gemmatimonadales bacterium]|nr:hypothetical protein [Gemmatimonadales bacterium]
MIRWVAWAVVLSTALDVGTGVAQRPDSTFTQAVQAYDNLDFHTASVLLRRVVATAPRGRSPGELEPALAYLGASEWFEGLRDSAVAAFRTLVILDPRYRLNELVFPPELTGAFADVRRATKVLDVQASPDTSFQARDGRFTAWLFASSPHPVTVSLLREDGTTLRTLYFGPVGDSLEVHWDGLDSAGAPVGPCTLLLSATSRGPDLHPIRTVRVQLDVSVIMPQMLPVPPPPADSLYLPEQVVKHGSGTSLAAGLIDAALVAILPSVIASGTHPSDARFAIAAGVAVAGLAEFVAHHGSRPIPDNIAANQRLKQAWQRRVDAAAQSNTVRRREPGLAIHVGPRVVIEQESF